MMSSLPLGYQVESIDSRTGFAIKLVIIAQALVIATLLSGLGAWQISRAEEKAERLALFETDKALPVEQVTPDLFRKVVITGRFIQDRYFLLDNRTWQGKAGYEVLAVVQTPNRNYLVNLGWTAANINRAVLPQIVLPDAPIQFEAHLDQPQNLLLLGQDIWPANWPLRIQAQDIEKMQQQLGLNLSDWTLRPTSALQSQAQPIWSPVVLPPERHLGYAVQWFGLAVVWCIGSIVLFSKFYRNNHLGDPQ